MISTPKAVTSTPEGYFEVDFKNEQAREEAFESCQNLAFERRQIAVEKPAQFRRLSLKNPEIPNLEAFAVNDEPEIEEGSNSNSGGSEGNSDNDAEETVEPIVQVASKGEDLMYFLRQKDLMINLAIMTL